MKLSEIQNIAFEMIGLIGPIRSQSFELLDSLKQKNISKKIFTSKLNALMDQLNIAGKKHLEIIQKEAQGIELKNSILFMHAEDLYISTQTMLELLIRLI